jgi:hypothetical protein
MRSAIVAYRVAVSSAGTGLPPRSMTGALWSLIMAIPLFLLFSAYEYTIYFEKYKPVLQ